MCGIAGYFGNKEPIGLAPMAGRLAHRGPDGVGFWSDPDARVGLAHRRLAIIDPTEAAAQPMASCNGRYQVVFNGEIYNFRQLGNELRQHGYDFNPHSDTAVLGPLFDRHGEDMLQRLNGIFAFAMWDRETRKLIVARDAFGVKPIYHARLQRGGIAFASELKALVGIEGLEGEIDAKALSDYLTYLWSPGERTLHARIRKLPPGHLIRVSSDRITIERWHHPAQRRQKQRVTKETIAELGSLVDEVVSDQCVSDVPIGAFLSGGVDSSAVVASMVRTGHRPARTYCIGFDGTGMADEGFDDDLAHARDVAANLGVPLQPVIVSAPTADDLSTLVYMIDEPEADPAALYVAAIAKAARADGIKVLLSGTGGDDVFSGYRRHKAAALRARLPAPAAPVLQAALRLARAVSSSSLRRRIGKLAYMFDGSDDAFLLRSFEFSPRATALECLSHDVNEQLVKGGEANADWLEAAIVRSCDQPLVERMLDLEFSGFLPDHNLNYTDKAGMAHGVEVRVPLLDQRLVNFAATVPWQLKTTWTEEKWIFRQAIARRVPRSVLTRKKTGFGGPVRRWLAGHLRLVVEDVINSASFRERGLFNHTAVGRLLDDTIHGRRDGAYPTLAIVLVELWLRRFGCSSSTPSPAFQQQSS